MALKYDQLDADLFSWLRKRLQNVTTAQAINALSIGCTTAKRHISRRFTQLEDRGALVCEIQGTTRVCRVVSERLPTTLAKAPRIGRLSIEPVNQNIVAANADEFLASGGTIERLPAAWENPAAIAPKGSLPMRMGTQALPFYRVDTLD